MTMENNNLQPLIQTEGITCSFNGGPPILDGINLKIHRSSTTVIIGPSGCGKSVLLKHLVGLLRPEKGHIYFDGEDITVKNEKEMVPIRRKIGFLFQGGALFDSMTVRENIIYPMKVHDVGDINQRNVRCKQVLRMVGLEGTEDRHPAELSGGQKKRIALARAIVLDPEVIFYDEPTTGLDPIRAALINELIIDLKQTLANTALIVTHDIESAKKVGDRILMLHKGNFILDSSPETLENTDNKIVKRFVNGQASQDEIQHHGLDGTEKHDG